jgi:hypothetical protein
MPRRIKLFEPRSVLRLGILAIVLAIALLILWLMMIWMPGQKFSGPLPSLTAAEVSLRDRLRSDIEKLQEPRNITFKTKLDQTAQRLVDQLSQMGYQVERQQYQARQQIFENLIVEIPGQQRSSEIIVVGAHYDTAYDAPGANDNGSGVAATLELARLYQGQKPLRTLRFVFFTNEEPPFHWQDDMGSLVYAKRCREQQEKILAMLSLETIGYYSDAVNSQKYPAPLDKLYPNTGNFLGFVSNIDSRELLRTAIVSFRRHTQFPSEGAALPNTLPGVGWSDHWSFWQVGYPAIMLTDTATFRYPFYHTEQDTPDKLDYDRMARVVNGIAQVIADLASAHHPK